MGIFDNIKNAFDKIFRPKIYAERQKKKKLEEEIEKTNLTKKDIKEPPKRVKRILEKPKPEEETLTPEEEQAIQAEKPENLTEEGKKIKEEKILITEEPTMQGIENPQGQDQTEYDKIQEKIKSHVYQTPEALILYGNASPTIDQVNNKINEALNEDWNGTYKIINATTGEMYNNELMQAVVTSGSTIDESIAKLIVINAEKFKPRFTSILELESDMGETVRLVFYGTLPQEIQEQVDKNEIIGVKLGSGTEGKVQELRKTIGQRVHASGSAVEANNVTQGTVANYKLMVQFR